MARNQRVFYATAEDVGEVLSGLEAMQAFQYTQTGMFTQRERPIMDSFREIPGFGIAVHPTAAGNPSFLMALRGESVESEEIPQKAGGVLYSVVQRSCPNAIFLKPGGRYGVDVILNGMVGTVSIAPQSLTLYRIVAKVFQQKFSPVNEFLVGPRALQAWNAGARLTIAVQSPPEFNLRRWEPES